MFRFENPECLYLLAAVPVLAVLRYALLLWQRRRMRRFGDAALLRQLAPDVSRWRPEAKFWLAQAALALLALMAARPQMGTKVSQEKRSGIETVIAVDISNSMMAEDVAPSRLMRTKMMVENLVDKFNDDKVALVVFAGDAFVQLPITSDNVSAKMFLANITPSLIATQGTDLARAIDLSAHSFSQQEGVGRAIIVITDGEDHEGGATEAAEAARKKGMRVFVLGVGSTSGSPIPDGNGGYMVDESGNTVMSALNEQMCREVADAGGGAYIHVDNNSNAQAKLDAELSKLAKKEMETTVYSEYDEQFQAFGVLALLLLVAEVCLLERKNPALRRVSLFKRKRTVALLALLSLCTASALAQSDRQLIREGNRHFRKGNYSEAEVAYRKAAERNPQNPQALYNLGVAIMANQKNDSLAIRQFEAAIKAERNPHRKAASYYNIGYLLQLKQFYGDAIEQYKEALRLAPYDDQARYNLELCKRNKHNDRSNKGQDKNKQDKKNQQQQQKQQQQQQQDKDKKDKQDKQKQPKQDKQNMSKDNAEQLLNAAMQQEKATQDKMKKALRQPGSRKLQKNW